MDARVFNTNPNALKPFIVEVEGEVIREQSPRYSMDGEPQLARIKRFPTEDSALAYVARTNPNPSNAW